MDSMMDWAENAKLTDDIKTDRRRNRRYGLHLDLRWKLIRRRRVLDRGVGRTVDLSSGGILFDSGRPLEQGMNVELSISWPVLLRNVAPMQMVVIGRVVRCAQNLTALTMVQHEFRTAGISSEHRVANIAETRTPSSLFGNGSRVTEFGKSR
jgi:PilZ domain